MNNEDITLWCKSGRKSHVNKVLIKPIEAIYRNSDHKSLFGLSQNLQCDEGQGEGGLVELPSTS